jgi:hypothetical protein
MFDTPLCSGFGQYHSDKHATNPQPYTSVTLNDILALLDNPQQVDKATAQWVIPSSLLSRSKDEQLEGGQFYALWQDIDEPKGQKIQSMTKVLSEVVGSTVWAYTSKSATSDNQKCRMIIPLAQPIDADTFNKVQRVINSKLLQAGITPDIANERVNQVFYLPNRGDYYEHCTSGEILGYFDTATIAKDLAKLWASDQQAESERLAAREVSRAKAATRVSAGTHSPIEAFNAEYDIHSLLIGYCYLKKGNRWLSPNSSSGISGLTVKSGKYHTSHQSDINAGLRATGDAFDLFTFYEHGSDRDAALTAVGAMFRTQDGLSMTKANQRAYMQAQDKDLIDHGAQVAAVLLANSDTKEKSKMLKQPNPPATLATSATSQWDSEPMPLTRSSGKMQAYPITGLGDVLTDTLRELAQTVQAPVPLIANSLLAAAGLVTQPYANVRLLHGSEVPCSLFAITVGDSGERKSAIDGYVLAPVRAYQKKLAEQCNTDKMSYEIERQAYESAARQAKATGGKKKKSIDDIRDELESLGQPPSPPIEPIILCSDPTAEGIFRQLAGGQPSIGMFTDEGGLFTSGFAMQDGNKLATLARMSKLWSGDSFDRVRGGDGVSILYDRRMSLHLMMQGIVARTLFSDGIANEQGFLPRCLIAFPESTAGERLFIDRDPMNSRALKRYFAVISDILETPKPTSERNEQELNPPTLELNHHARAMLIDFHDEIERQLKSDGDYFVIKGTANKIVEHAARIAGVITIIEHGATAAIDGVMIDETIMTNAITLARWYLDEWKRIFTSASVPETIQLAQLLQQWVLSERNPHKPYFYGRHVLRLGHNRLRTKTALEAATLTLEEHGLCRKIDPIMLDGAIRQNVYEVRVIDDCVAEVASVATPLTSENSVFNPRVAEVASVAGGLGCDIDYAIGANAVAEEVF